MASSEISMKVAKKYITIYSPTIYLCIPDTTLRNIKHNQFYDLDIYGYLLEMWEYTSVVYFNQLLGAEKASQNTYLFC